MLCSLYIPSNQCSPLVLGQFTCMSGFEQSVPTSIKWIAMKFGTDSDVPLGRNCNNFGDALKGNSTDFTHQSLFTCLGEYYYM